MNNHTRIRRLQKKAGQVARAMGEIQETMFLHWRDVENVEAEIEIAKRSPLWGKQEYIWLPVKLQEDKGI